MKLLGLAVAALAMAWCSAGAQASGTAPGLAAPRPQAIGLAGSFPDFQSVAISSPHVYDYTFATAPTDWRVESGIWEMTNRWACSPGWSWFGGRSNEVAAIWNKHKFSGNMSVQFYFAFKMENSGTYNPANNQYRWWEYPADAAVTIGGNGTDLSSGYTFIVGADDNRHTIFKRGNELIGESTAPTALLPSYNDGVPAEMDRLIHRRWWYVRVDKIGSKVACYLDNKLIFTYDDPKPLDAGQVAIWTYNNGIMLSRVQIYYDKEIKPVYGKTRLARSVEKRGKAALTKKSRPALVVRRTSRNSFAQTNAVRKGAQN